MYSLAFISASDTELRQRTKFDVAGAQFEPTAESLPSDYEPVEQVASAVVSSPVTTLTAFANNVDREDTMTTILRILPYLQTFSASLEYYTAVETIDSSQHLCCPAHNARLA